MERTTLTVKELASYLGLSVDLVYRLVRENEISYVRIGRRILFKKDSVERWLDAQEMNKEKMHSGQECI
ncbi:helix-turn-helix domain-containing protein [Halobacillus halophilus]|uniref:helix-turn-helix domain-containing protein n=1 Tax=Halobacillus halophilus TaxID=1570 RepID=UPI001CD1AF52|nr:helix-turn-helix domain-containing protein [Halobacillus halophilus]MCA1011383.1 helix-turn-helix domain-containing protein [Halobacillus halophilus]